MNKIKDKNRFSMKNDYRPANHQRLMKFAVMLAAMSSYTLEVERLLYVNYIIRNELLREKLCNNFLQKMRKIDQ